MTEKIMKLRKIRRVIIGIPGQLLHHTQKGKDNKDAIKSKEENED